MLQDSGFHTVVHEAKEQKISGVVSCAVKDLLMMIRYGNVF
jgi:hypothetical protein